MGEQALDENADIQLGKDNNNVFEGEAEEPKYEVKEMTEEEKAKHEKAKADKKKAKKKYEQEEERELTADDLAKIEKAKKDNDMKMAADLFGSDTTKSILDIKLEDELDYINFAKIVMTKLQGAKTKKFIIEFLGV